MMYFDKNFRRDCANNTASENKIDQMLQEFEINKQKKLLDEMKRNPQKQIKPNPEDEAKKQEEQKNQVKPNEALDKLLKAIKIETKTSKCLEMIKTLFKGHILELHPAHILDTVYLLTDIPLNYRKQDDLKYLIVILNIIIDAREHCILREYGNFYKIIDTFRINLLLFRDDSFQFQAYMKKINEHLNMFYEQTNYFKTINFQEPQEQEQVDQQKTQEQEQKPVAEQKQEIPQISIQQKDQDQLEDVDKKESNDEGSKVSAIRERLMKKKQEKLQKKDEEKTQNLIQQIPNQELQQQAEQAPQQIKLIKKEDIVQKPESKVAYEYSLSENLQNLLKSKLAQYNFQKKLLVKALMSMKHLLNREWSKISVYSLINDIFLNYRDHFDEQSMKKIDDFMSELQELKAQDSKKQTQRNIQESQIVGNAVSSKFDVKKVNLTGATPTSGDSLNAWASKQSGL
ncbi:hypothetical protein TTHERM_00895730 (macronuclear) [Tetrahymena thermophila SB210]|uniref:Uncharacterized protein n=1 Tax=Tetrahymena thermophila (strain SB210) TaxID=312017 RepID=Q22E54_TETTS|nr:hypothetical protein TTHERM_00895730 [Tetrahymena thermophila SB210]EAR83560.4 hypothetical protein TTHERM_00895730 [Tetrahymena thermophila SB210]|eukprot:XP_001031223.4 hypothetical protein TTHERM_00895730 [Tetrahymena thermophila SB210]